MILSAGFVCQSIARGRGPSPAAPKTDGKHPARVLSFALRAARLAAADRIMRTNIKTTLIALSLSCALFAQAGCNKPGTNQSGANAEQPQLAPGKAMTAEELVEAYRMEPADGPGKYKGQTLDVTGTVSRKGKDFQEQLYVDLKGENKYIEVHCVYNESQRELMSALQPGQQATIRGVCDGRFMSGVVLKNSVLVNK